MKRRNKQMISWLLIAVMILTGSGFSGIGLETVYGAQINEIPVTEDKEEITTSSDLIKDDAISKSNSENETTSTNDEEEASKIEEVPASDSESSRDEEELTETDETDFLLAKYSFDKLTATTDGTAIEDESGNNNTAHIRGNNAVARIGSLELPGGRAGSDSAYVQLPTGMFDSHDKVTISVWLQNLTGSGDYAAMYFGQGPQGNGMPLLYWILNPAKNGNFKSIITKYANPGAPYQTETAASSTKTDSCWQMYTTVISDNTITGYLDGVEVSREDMGEMTITRMGTDLVSYIGKSSYNDPFYKGGVKDVQIFATPLNGAEIKSMYDSATKEEKKSAGVKATSIQVDAISDESYPEGTNLDITTNASISFSNSTTKDNAVVLWKDSKTGDIIRNISDLAPGTYTLNGELSYFGNPVINQKADPYIIYDEETRYYYFTSSWPAYYNADGGYDRISIRRASTLEGLSSASENVIWRAHSSGEESKHVWAPELHKINGKWYIFYAANSDDNIWSIRPYVLECKEGSAILDASSWKEKGRFTNADGSYTNNFNGFSLDMTCFEDNGKTYVVWANKSVDNTSVLDIAELNTDEPWKLAGNSVRLSVPEYKWERVREAVNEGPAILKKNGKIYLTYSAAATGDEYCMGMLTADQGTDLLDLNNWTKSKYPILQTSDLVGEYGPGHNSFTVDENGNDIIVYHSRDQKCHNRECGYNCDSLYDPCRNANLAYVRWDENGNPVFSDTEREELSNVQRTGYTKKLEITDKGVSATPIAVYPLYQNAKDIEGKNDGILHGKKVKFDNGLIISGAIDSIEENYLDFSNQTTLLNGIEKTNNLTVTAWVKNDNLSNNTKNTVFSFGKDNKNFFAFNTMNWGNARASFVINDSENGFKYNTAGNTASVTGEWYPVAIVLKETNSGTNIKYYMNDQLYISTDVTTKISDLGDLSFFHLGAGVNSNYFDMIGGIRNVNIYNSALRASEIRKITNQEMSQNLLAIVGVDKKTNSVVLSENNSLPTYVNPDYQISWSSNIAGLISENGIITTPFKDTAASLSATVSANKLDSYQETVVFDATIHGISESFRLNEAKQALSINNIDDVRGNLYLPETGLYNCNISWTSADSSIISDKCVGKYKPGIVTRPKKDTNVDLTATISINGQSVEKVFHAKVKAAVGELKLEDYMFAYFTGDSGANSEQIYFGASKDGLSWEALNSGAPVITSTLGDKGLRDPFIIRSPEGDKFYLIATDLRIANGAGWGAAQTAGSKYIMIWESTDLVNWSEQRQAKVAVDGAGCTWAPEAFYDDETGEYIVFWASKTSADNYGIHQIYYCTTRDFYTFSEPKIWITLKNKDGRKISVIDTSVIATTDDNGKKTYYRISKNEEASDAAMEEGEPSTGKYTYLETSDSLTGEWTRIPSSYLTNTQYVEGGTFFKFNNEEKWCLLLDSFGSGGYFPSVTSDLNSGNFTKLDQSEYSFPSTMRHGTVIGVTKEEYNALQKKWGIIDEDKTASIEASKIAHFTFDDDETGLDGYGAKVRAASGNINYSSDSISGNAVSLSSASKQYLNVAKEDGSGLLNGYNALTINYYSKPTSSDNVGWSVFIGPNANAQTYMNEHYLGIIDKSNDITIQRYNNYSESRPTDLCLSGLTPNTWKMVTVVIEQNETRLYINGELKLTEASTKKLSDIAGRNGIFQIGKANWGSGEYYNGLIDEMTIYNKALTSNEVKYIAGLDIQAESISIHSEAEGNEEQTIKVGEKLQFFATVLPEYTTDSSVTWNVSDPEIAEIDENGLLKAKSMGNVTVTATTNDGSNLSDSRTVSVLDISKIRLSDNMITLGKTNYTYTGDQILPPVTVKDQGKKLVKNVDYVIQYSNNINAGKEAHVIITGMGNYSGSIIKTFTITPTAFSKAVINEINDCIYTGEIVKPEITVTYQNMVLKEDKDYKTIYSQNPIGNKEQDTVVKVTVSGMGNFSGIAKSSKSFVILHNSDAINLSDNNQIKVVFKDSNNESAPKKQFVYNGKIQKPAIVVKDIKTGKALNKKYYKIVYKDCVNAGVGTIQIVGKGKAYGIAELTFEINKRDLANVKISKLPKVVYDGNNIADLTLTVKDLGKYLYENVDFLESFEGIDKISTKKAKASVILTAAENSNYKGTKSLGFDIIKRSLTDKKAVDVKVSEVMADGRNKVIPESVIVTYHGEVIDPSNYTVTYKNNNRVTNKASVVITAKKDSEFYTGKTSKYFTILAP